MMDAHSGGKRTQGIKAQGGGPGRPLVSIVTVVYNGKATLERTINSVLQQRYPHIEYIIVDGGSTDGTIGLLKRYEDRIDLWTSGKDKGIYDAMNKGLALCTGDWIGLINADDWYEPDTVERVVKAAADRSEISVVHGDIWLHYPNGHRSVKKARVSGFLLKYWEMVLNHPSFFVRTELYRKQPFDAALKVSADHKWTYEAFRRSPSSFLYLPVPLANFTVGGASMSTPLRKVIAEGRKVSRDLGMNTFETMLGLLVRTVLYPMQHAKLWINEHVLSRSK